MKKKLLTSVLLISFLAGGTTCVSEAFGAQLTRKQKKEVKLLDTASAVFDMKQYDLAIEYLDKAIEVNP